MKYKNKYSKKIKNSYLLLITCASCKEEIVLYQKQGKGGLLNMYIERILEANLKLDPDLKALSCPRCHETLGIKASSSDSFRMIRGAFHSKKV